MKHEQWFPIQGEHGTADNGEHYERPAGRVPWGVAELAYKTYVKNCGNSQSLELLAARGGFGWTELVRLLEGSYWSETPVPFACPDETTK